ncbi:MAG TPA: hypothetical protein VF032_19390, partial [Thermoleophilaceae bacterium]
VTPKNRDHYLAFGLSREVSRNQPGAGIVSDVADRGGFGFCAHPFSQGSKRFRRVAGMPWTDFECERIEGLEVWSFVTDTAEKLESLAAVAGFVAAPERLLDHPPERNLAEWDRLCGLRRVVGIAGIDAHQIGFRVRERVPVRLMSYARSFRFLRTHVLTAEALDGELEHDAAQVYAALREGRCYMSVDSLAPPRGFSFGAGQVPMGGEAQFASQTLVATLPRPAHLRLVRNGELIAERDGSEIEHEAAEPGVYRVEARLNGRTWILSNPVYLR